MPMSMKDLCLHVSSMQNPHSSAEALVMGIADMVEALKTRTEVANAAADLRNNVAALAGSIFWGTPFQGSMAKPQPVEPPWTPPPAQPAQDAPPAAVGAHLAVEPEVEHVEPPEAEDAPSEPGDEHGEAEDEEADAYAAADEPENGPVDRPAPRAKPKPKHKPVHRRGR